MRCHSVMESLVECVPNVYKLMVPLSVVSTQNDAFAKERNRIAASVLEPCSFIVCN
jgi:hypothetical protein